MIQDVIEKDDKYKLITNVVEAHCYVVQYRRIDHEQ